MSGASPSEYHRYCPGEESLRISDAVCRGRRRASFHKCRGCQFNDDERAAREATPAVEPPPARNAPPPRAGRADAASVELTTASERRAETFDRLFRSADIRGRWPAPLSADVAWRIGHAAAQFLRSKLKGYRRADARARAMVTGRDQRASSAALHESLLAGIRSTGVAVCDIGLIDTPQMYFAVRHLGAGGAVVTTGGRSSAEYSGFKLCGADGRDVASVTGLIDIRDIARRVPLHDTGATAEQRHLDLADAYREFVRRWITPDPQQAATVVIDAAGGVAARWAPRIFNDIDGLRLVMVNNASDDISADEGAAAVDPDPFEPAALAGLRQRLRAEKADLGVRFDGDADACVFLDERGALIRPDFAMALLARHYLETLGPGAIVIDHRASRSVREEIEHCGGIARPETPDSAAIRKTMIETNAIFGASLSGQFFFRDNGCCESGVIALAGMLNVLSSGPRRLSDRIRPLLRYKSSGERRIECADPPAALARVGEHFAGRAWRLGTGLSVHEERRSFHLDRHPGDAALILRAEAATPELLSQTMAELQPLLGYPATVLPSPGGKGIGGEGADPTDSDG